MGEGRHAYLVPATGAVDIDGTRYEARDGIAISGGQTVEIRAIDDAELVLVDGMGHDLPAPLFGMLADAVRRTADRAAPAPA